jgi:hypothetical protein
MLCAMHQRESLPWAEPERVNHVDPVWHGTSETLCPGRRGRRPAVQPGASAGITPSVPQRACIPVLLLGSLPGMGTASPLDHRSFN